MGDPTAELIGAIINAGKTGWEIVKGSKATTSAKASFCSAVPENMPFQELSGWKLKSSKWTYKTVSRLSSSITLSEAKLVYSFRYGGTSDKVPGAMFVTNFSVYAETCFAFPMIDLNIDATVSGKPVNVGSKTAPIAAIPLLISCSTGGSASISRTYKLTARGDGKLEVS